MKIATGEGADMLYSLPLASPEGGQLFVGCGTWIQRCEKNKTYAGPRMAEDGGFLIHVHHSTLPKSAI